MDESIQPIAKQKQVVYATTLLWLALAIGVANSVLTNDNTLPLGQQLEVGGFVLWISAFLIIKISQGRNWARITFLIISLIGIILSPPIIVNMYKIWPLSASIVLLQGLLQIAALIMLFGKPASIWFKSARLA